MTDPMEPCPFCGGDGELIERHNPMSKWRHSVDCSSTTCGASGPVEATKAEAVTAWNTRPLAARSMPSDLGRLVERLRARECLHRINGELIIGGCIADVEAVDVAADMLESTAFRTSLIGRLTAENASLLATIAADRARIAGLENVLEPFAGIAETIDDVARADEDDDRIWVVQAYGCRLAELTEDDFRKAAAFLQSNRQGRGGMSDVAEIAKGPWLCFHCGELCETHEAAAEHFGEGNYEMEQPLCIEAASTEMKTLVLTNREMFTRLMKIEGELEQAEFERDCWAEAGRSATSNPVATWHDLRGNLKIDELEGRALAAEAAINAAPRWLAQFFRRLAERRWHRTHLESNLP